MNMRNFIEITDFTTDELLHILNRADELKVHWHNNEMPQSLEKQRIALLFCGNGFRNRMAFEIGARAMGADVSYVPGELGIDEPLEDVGHYLKNWFSMLIIRAKSHEYLVSVSKDASIPTINARTDYNHPCEILGDLQYIRRIRGSIDELNVVFVGEVTNLCMSWFKASVRFPINVIQVGPKQYLFPDEEAKRINKNAIGKISTSVNLKEEITKKVEVIYTDCWPKSGDIEKVRELFLPYQITTEILGEMNHKGFFLPCPPVSRGQEVCEESMLSEKCKDYEAKECLLHSQNAIMEYLVHRNGI